MRVPLFLYHHDGVAIIFTNFQLDTLRFVHCTLYALTGYTTCNGPCCSSQRTPGSATNSISRETTKYSTANCADNVGIITALNLYLTYINDGAIADILYLFRFRSGINIPDRVSLLTQPTRDRPTIETTNTRLIIENLLFTMKRHASIPHGQSIWHM